MGGVVDAISNVIKNVTEVGKDLINEVTHIAIEATKFAIDIAKDIFKGDNPLDTASEHLSDILHGISDVFKSVYTNILDPYFGIDDTKFLGMKGWVGSTLGSGTKDLLYDHAKTTVMISALIGTLVVAWAYAPMLSEYLASEVALYAHTTFAITNAAAMIAIFEGTSFIASLGISYLLSGAITGVVGSAFSPLAYLPLVDSYLLKESALNLTNFKDTLSGLNFEKMAGGLFYNEVYSGGQLYSFSQDNSLNASVGGDFNLSLNTKQNEAPFLDFAGGSYGERFNLTLMT